MPTQEGDKAPPPLPPRENLPAVSPHENRDDELPPALQSLIELERERLESQNRRTDIIRYAIETNDASDKRQFDYRMAKLDTETKAGRGWFTLARAVVYVTLVIAALLLTFLMWMIFYGDARQSATAFTIAKVIGTALGGYGFIEGAKRALAQLFKRSGGSS